MNKKEQTDDPKNQGEKLEKEAKMQEQKVAGLKQQVDELKPEDDLKKGIALCPI